MCFDYNDESRSRIVYYEWKILRLKRITFYGIYVKKDFWKAIKLKRWNAKFTYMYQQTKQIFISENLHAISKGFCNKNVP